MKHLLIFLLFFCLYGCGQSSKKAALDAQSEKDKKEIKRMHRQYVDSWLKGDENGVLSLFAEDARIQPGSLDPIDSIGNIKKFWFPHDGSTTLILKFDTDVFCTKIDGDYAITTQKSFLDWTYNDDSTHMAVEQAGYAMTVYRRQSDGGWKIWRQKWSDVYSKEK